MTNRPSDIIKSRVYTPEQVDYIVRAKGRESASFLAAKYGTIKGSICKVWEKAKMAGIVPSVRRVVYSPPSFDPSRPQPSMPRVAWLERPMPRVNV